MQAKWIILIILVLMMTQSTIKKEGKFSFRCSEDKSQIEIYRKDMAENKEGFVVYEECNENAECKVIDNLPVCIMEETEIIKKATPPLYTPLLVIGIIFIFILWKIKK